MADRRDFFFRQRVTEGELDGAFDGVEQADWNLAMDAGIVGVISGGVASENSPQDLSILLSGPAVGYDKAGRRLRFGAEQTVDCSVDENSVSTAVGAPGNERWLSVFLEFDRSLSDPRIDGASQQVYFERNEGFAIVVRAGAEAAIGAGVRPSLDGEALLICDVQLTNGQVQILNGDIYTDRREAFVIYSATQISAATGGFTVIAGANVQAALASADAELASQQVLQTNASSRMDDHVGGVAENHSADQITVDSGSFVHLLTVADAQAAFALIDGNLRGLSELMRVHTGSKLFSGGEPTDGGGLTLNIASADYISSGEFYEASAQTEEMPDDDVSWVYLTGSGIGVSSFGSGAGAGTAVPIARVTTVGGAITEILDLRIIDDNRRKTIKVRVGSDNSAHFSRLSEAITALEAWRSIYTLVDFDVELVGIAAEDDLALLPITFQSDGWRVRGLPNSRLECQVATTTELIRIAGVDDIVIEDVEIRFTTGTAPDNTQQDRYTFFGSDADRVVLRRINQPEFTGIGEGVHGFIFFDLNETCSRWLIEGCEFSDGRDFAIQVPSTGGLGGGVLIDSVIRDCIFQRHSGGNRWIPTHGISMAEGADVLIDNCEIRDFEGSGISVGTAAPTRRVRVTNCRIRDVGGAYGITLQTQAEQCHVAHCDIDGISDPADGVGVSGDYNFVAFNHTVATARFGVNTVGAANGNVFVGNQSRGTGNNIAAGNGDTGNRDDV